MKQAALRGKIIAAVRIRGTVNVRSSIGETMDRLNLHKPNNCTIIKVNDPYLGMLKKCVNHIAYGEVDEETLAKLVTKFKLNIDPKGLINGKVDATDLNEKMPMRLHPPRHGMKSVRKHFNQGGSLGYMGKEINGLINRMV
jgi:large subunit ribosomal protein L30